TGHRKNLTAAQLLPLDAPVQQRKYRGPSSTSKKEFPAFAIANEDRALVSSRNKKRKSSADSDDEDEDEDEASGKVPKLKMGEDAIAAKRLQNTIAARKSRQRKLDHVRELEGQLE
ncbi:hypothetical protein DL93DRAFT_2037572, partial [Clavulina sp. PMI_390]